MYRYLMYHKPRGELTARKDQNRKTVMDAFPEEYRDLFPVGRLDKETEGLLLFTDDGSLTARLLHPRHHVEKTYLFYSHGHLTDEDRQALENGVFIDLDKTVRTAKAKLCVLKECPLSELRSELSEYEQKRLRGHEGDMVTVGTLTITEGKKHQVRKMLLAVGGRVIYLKRIAFGPLSLGDLPLGALRPLTKEEIAALTLT
ncbi:MAG: rRNA pseudouridine synthase [Clostridia bacterium]|nr:rRNA pseudouridine synthase [Clostridia bacterium]